MLLRSRRVTLSAPELTHPAHAPNAPRRSARSDKEHLTDTGVLSLVDLPSPEHSLWASQDATKHHRAFVTKRPGFASLRRPDDLTWSSQQSTC